MPRRFLAALVATVAILALLPVASASAAGPWGQVTTSSRPTYLWTPQNEVQELKRGELTLVLLKGSAVACMGEACPSLGLPNDETAAELQTSLETPEGYGPSNVEVSEAPSGGGRFLITSVGADSGRYLTDTLAVEGEGSAAVVSEGGSGRMIVTLTNLGDASAPGSTTPITISDALPENIAAYRVDAEAGAEGTAGPVNCTLPTSASVTCSFAGSLPPYESIELEIYVSVTADPPQVGASGEVAVGGGNAPPRSAAQAVHLSPDKTPFGVESYSLEAEREGGLITTQAGSHPFQLTTTILLNQGALPPGSRREAIEEQPALPRTFRFHLPAGLVGNATAVPRCSSRDFTTINELRDECPPQSAIGVAAVTIIEHVNLGLIRLAVPIFNLPPAHGEPARFGFVAAGVPVVLNFSVASAKAYKVTASTADVPQSAQFLASTVSIWGTPASPMHDGSRGWACAYFTHPGTCTRPEGLQERPLLRLPTSCGSPLAFPMELEPWNVPLGSEVTDASSTGVALDGCNREPFGPTIEVEPGTREVESAGGLTVHLKVPQEASEAPEGIAVSDVRNTKVALPPSLYINPAAANGLQACSEGQIGFSHMNGEEPVFDEGPATCPEASKLGRVKITSPLLEEPVVGWVYQAAQEANPFHSLLALYVDAEAPNAGVHVKLAGKVETDKQTGQVVSTFDETPQLPFEEFELTIFGGSGAPLATSTCGAYKTETQIDPWSGGATATPSSEFKVSGCPSLQPFAPSFSAGTEAPLAGIYSPFVLNLTRKDGEGQLSRIDAALPAGLAGKLAGIPYCPETAIHQAEGRSNPGEGSLEQQSPSCPAASQVGTVRVGAGVGPQPYYVNGSVYLAGPYKGAPLSLVIVTPAVAGPFDLGTVVVRTALYVNEETTQVSAKSDPLPTMLQGIPLDVRSIALRLDRSNFTLNPTSCEAMTLGGTATSSTGQSATLANRFQVGGCKGLAFAPKLALKVFGKTNRNAKPRLRAVLQAKPGEANIRRAQVNLPHSEFLEQNHIKTVCTRVQWNAGAGHGEQCPPSSIYGNARAITPLLDQPLEGPVYLRSNGGERKLPDLVAALNGQIDVALWGKVDSGPNKGIRNTFEVVPDAPVTKFILEMKGGKKGLLVNSENLCSKGAERQASARFTGQNGAVETIKPNVVNECKKSKKSRKSQRSS